MPVSLPSAALAALLLSVAAGLSPSAAAPAQKSSSAAQTTLVTRIDLSSQSMTVSYDGKVQHRWDISSGRSEFPTPRGTYRPQWTSKMWYSRKYDNAPMPHAVFFVGGVAVHGTQSISMLGRPASHGCIRLAPANAAKFYALVHQHGLKRTRIEVFGTPPATAVAQRKPSPSRTNRVASSRQPSQNSGWGNWSWGAPAATAPRAAPSQRPQPMLRRGPGGLYYLPPGSPVNGQATIVHNGVVYRRVR